MNTGHAIPARTSRSSTTRESLVSFHFDHHHRILLETITGRPNDRPRANRTHRPTDRSSSVQVRELQIVNGAVDYDEDEYDDVVAAASASIAPLSGRWVSRALSFRKDTKGASRVSETNGDDEENTSSPGLVPSSSRLSCVCTNNFTDMHRIGVQYLSCDSSSSFERAFETFPFIT